MKQVVFFICKCRKQPRVRFHPKIAAFVRFSVICNIIFRHQTSLNLPRAAFKLVYKDESSPLQPHQRRPPVCAHFLKRPCVYLSNHQTLMQLTLCACVFCAQTSGTFRPFFFFSNGFCLRATPQIQRFSILPSSQPISQLDPNRKQQAGPLMHCTCAAEAATVQNKHGEIQINYAAKDVFTLRVSSSLPHSSARQRDSFRFLKKKTWRKIEAGGQFVFSDQTSESEKFGPATPTTRRRS